MLDTLPARRWQGVAGLAAMRYWTSGLRTGAHTLSGQQPAKPLVIKARKRTFMCWVQTMPACLYEQTQSIWRSQHSACLWARC